MDLLGQVGAVDGSAPTTVRPTRAAEGRRAIDRRGRPTMTYRPRRPSPYLPPGPCRRPTERPARFRVASQASGPTAGRSMVGTATSPARPAGGAMGAAATLRRPAAGAGGMGRRRPGSANRVVTRCHRGDRRGGACRCRGSWPAVACRSRPRWMIRDVDLGASHLGGGQGSSPDRVDLATTRHTDLTPYRGHTGMAPETPNAGVWRFLTDPEPATRGAYGGLC